jgi:hypothetical protein
VETLETRRETMAYEYTIERKGYSDSASSGEVQVIETNCPYWIEADDGKECATLRFGGVTFTVYRSRTSNQRND